MKRTLASLVLALGLLLPADLALAAAPAAPAAASALPAIPVGPVVGGSAQDLSWAKLRGKVVLLDFFSKSCRPCLAAMPDIVKLQADHKDRLSVVGYHIGRGTAVEIEDLIRRQKLNYPVIIPPDFDDRKVMIPGQPFLEAFGSEMLPAASIIDESGKLVAWNLAPAAARAKVLELLGRQPR